MNRTIFALSVGLIATTASVNSNIPELAFWALVSLGFISMGIVNRKY